MKNCTRIDHIPVQIKWATGIGSAIVLLVVVLSLACWGWQRRKMSRLKRKFFEQNGGHYLQQYLRTSLQRKETASTEHENLNTFCIYTLKEIEKATKNFAHTQFLGRGGHGSVYKGVLDNNRAVAVKKSMMVDETRNKEYAREIFILSQINHVNVVKLLGCCLEADIPMLVYEYMANDTLFQLIHERRPEQEPFPWAFRLRLAAESAKAFAYMHSEASPPILHGDIKSSNILLDDNYNAKVSDFGTSTLAPQNKAQIMTFVQGTCGYLDPEYMQTSKLTEKSDVYSFGVVLAELLTGKTAIGEHGKHLSSTFISSMMSGQENLMDILDPLILTEEDGSVLEQVRAVANLTFRCLNLNGDQRPEMVLISKELQGMLESVSSQPWIPGKQEETEKLIGQGNCNTLDIDVDH